MYTLEFCVFYLRVGIQYRQKLQLGLYRLYNVWCRAQINRLQNRQKVDVGAHTTCHNVFINHTLLMTKTAVPFNSSSFTEISFIIISIIIKTHQSKSGVTKLSEIPVIFATEIAC